MLNLNNIVNISDTYMKNNNGLVFFFNVCYIIISVNLLGTVSFYSLPMG